ncbi:MAG: MJ0042-type zinc finger domain-containing protein [Caulobacteraceae bacterium]
MILTCPACASRYFVDEAKLPPQGRQVRCAACGESWRAEPNVELLDLTPQFDPIHEAAEPELAPTTPAEALPKAFRQQVQAQQRTRAAVAAGVVWAGMAASLTVLVLLSVVFRVQVVKVWPRTAGVYAALKLPVNPLGLAPDNVVASQGLQNGHAALIVTGAERNVATQTVAPAPMRVSVYDKSGARLLSRVVLPAGPIAPGESRPFAASFVDPPMAGVQVGVDFVFEPNRPAARAMRPSPYRQAAIDPAPHLRGLDNLAPVVPAPLATPAKALPVNSPYALPTAARTQAD